MLFVAHQIYQLPCSRPQQSSISPSPEQHPQRCWWNHHPTWYCPFGTDRQYAAWASPSQGIGSSRYWRTISTLRLCMQYVALYGLKVSFDTSICWQRLDQLEEVGVRKKGSNTTIWWETPFYRGFAETTLVAYPKIISETCLKHFLQCWKLWWERFVL